MTKGIDSTHMPPAAIANADNWITSAIEKDFDFDKLERILEMRARLKEEFARDSFYAALAKFQAELPEIPKTRAVYEKNGEETRYYFAPLGDIIKAVKELLKKHGLSYTLKAYQEDGKVKAECFYHHENGYRDSTTFWVPIESGAYMTGPQKAGSAMTYAKRYAFCNAFGIMTADGDDDAAPKDTTVPTSIERAMAVIYSATREAVRDGIMTTEQFLNAALGLEDFVDQHDNLENPVQEYAKAIVAKIRTLRGDAESGIENVPETEYPDVPPDALGKPVEMKGSGEGEKTTIGQAPAVAEAKDVSPDQGKEELNQSVEHLKAAAHKAGVIPPEQEELEIF